MSEAHAPPPWEHEFSGGRTATLVLGVGGVIALVLTAVGYAFEPTATLYSYLFAFAFWLSLSLGSLMLLAVFHASSARWVTAIRRPLEIGAVSSAVFALLFVPIALGMPKLFVWVSPPSDLPHHVLHLIEHKRPYLNVPFFLIRAGLYFSMWIIVSHLLRTWSRRQDAQPGAVELLVWQRRLSAGMLPVLAFSLAFASFDWLMSLEPTWFSTMYGVYFFSGAFVGAIGLWAVVLALGRGRGLTGDAATPALNQNVGKFLLAFVIFWAYIGYSQYMLIWIANLPEEVGWYASRAESWRRVAIVLVIAHFVLPFFALLSRRLKANPRYLAAVGGWVLLAHALDVFWLVIPTRSPAGPDLRWTDLTAFLGVGGVAIAFALLQMRGTRPVPVGDPYLHDSLEFSQP